MGWASGPPFVLGATGPVQHEALGRETSVATSEAGVAREIERLIEPNVLDLGYSIVRVQIIGQQDVHLQVMIERKDFGPMHVDECAKVSRAISAILDVEDPIQGHYDLEVSTPGIDRPLTRREDFERFTGFEAKVEIERPIDGRKRFRGKILGLEGDKVRLVGEDTEWQLPINDIGRAKLIVTDELLAAAAGEQYES
jgi:ribosome maturation factor RimP